MKQQLCWKYPSNRKSFFLFCFPGQRQEMTASTETLDMSTDASAPQALPYHSNTSTLRSADSPKREATEIYLKSKALLDSRRRCLDMRHTFLFFVHVSNLTCHMTHFQSLCIRRASHQRHWCLSEEGHRDRLWLPGSGRRRSTTASQHLLNLFENFVL